MNDFDIEMIERADKHTKFIAKLKKDSNYYPEILFRDLYWGPPASLCFKSKPRCYTIYVSTLVRIQRNDQWYSIHCAESIMVQKGQDDSKLLLLRLIKSVCGVQHLYIPIPGITLLDKCQELESERLQKLIPNI